MTGATGDPGTTGEQGPTGGSGATGPQENLPRELPNLERLAKEIERMSRPTGDAARDQERARELREMARKMMEKATPEQREQIKRLAQEMAKRREQRGDGPGNEAGDGDVPRVDGQTRPYEGATMPVDARRTTVAGQNRPRERTVAEWYGDGPMERDGGSGGVQAAMREAAQGAERAIEQQQVPARYQELVRRVFRRYSERGASGESK